MVWIFIWDTAPSKIYVWWSEVASVRAGDTKVRPTTPPYLCFSAEQANSTVKLNKNWSPTAVNLETSTDWQTWSDYTIWNTITLSAVGDKVYWRNKSDTNTGFSTTYQNYYYFSTTWAVAASWDINYLVNKNSVTTLVWDFFYYKLFQNNRALTTPPALTATTLTQYCYYNMFYSCTALKEPPKLPATTLANGCYDEMFAYCNSLNGIPLLSATNIPTGCYYEMFMYTKLKISSTQDSNYTQPYRIPTTWTWTAGNYPTYRMFYWNSSAIDTPDINTTYYVHKDNVIVG